MVALLSVEALQLAPHEMDAKIRDDMAKDQEQQLSDKERAKRCDARA